MKQIIFFLLTIISLTSMTQEQTPFLNEYWSCQIDKDNDIHEVYRHSFDTTGVYTFEMHRNRNSYCESASGTYRYQPETGEILIHVDAKYCGGTVGKYAPKRNYNLRIKIMEIDDTKLVAEIYEDIDVFKTDKNGNSIFTGGESTFMKEYTFYRQPAFPASK